MQENLIEKELKRPLFGRAIRRREGQGDVDGEWDAE